MSNTLTGFNSANVQGPILAVLRQNAVVPRLCMNLRGSDGVNKGSTIDVPYTGAITARDITAAITPAANQDIITGRMQLTFDYWQEASFHFTDREAAFLREGVISEQMNEALKSIGNAIDNTGLYELRSHYSYNVGVPGTTPFAATSVTALAQAKRILSQQLAPVGDRVFVCDPVAEINLLQVPSILDASQYGGAEGVREGRVGNILGFGVFVNQNVATLTAGTTAWGTGYSFATGGASAGVTTITVINATCHGIIYAGYMFKSGAGYYAVYTTVTAVTNTNQALVITPALATAAASGDAVTVIAAYTPNVAFHRNALAFASRPATGAFSPNTQSVTDPVTGVTLTFKITDEYYQQTMRVSALWGWESMRPQWIVPILG